MALAKETNTDYDYSTNIRNVTSVITNPVFRSINLSNSQNNNQASSGINSIKLETDRIISSNPSLITSGSFPLLITNSITTVTDYEYWDADSLGITYSNGFEQLLNNSSVNQGSWGLTYEPSFELFRTTKTSPHLADAFMTTENYYYYDLKQDINVNNTLNNYQNSQFFDGLNYSMMYGIRNLMYQKRITSKAANQPAIAKSEYYWYDTRTTTDTTFINDTLHVGFGMCPVAWNPDTIVVGGGSSGGHSGYNNTLGCITIPSHGIITPPIGYSVTQVRPGVWMFCPNAVQLDSAQINGVSRKGNTSNFRYRNLPSDMKTKLVLRRIDEQVDTIKNNLAYFHKYHPLVRFYELYTSAYTGGPNNLEVGAYNWYLPYKTKTKYRTLEHTIFGQVRLDMNERGLKTRYNYQTVYSTTFVDTALTCPSVGGAYDLTNQGVPKCITVGSGLPDSLTTCYTYNKDFTINSITDPNGMVLSYKYDNFSRMRMAIRNSDTLSVNQYSQWMNDTTLTFEQRSEQNYVESYILLNKGSSVAEHSRAYIDPLGRKYDVLTQVSSNYTNPTVFDTLMIHSGLTTYDNWDRVLKQYKPFKYTNSGSPVSFAPMFNPTASFTEQQYEGNQRGHVLRAAKFGQNINTGHTVNSTYQIISGLQLKTELGGASYGTSNLNEITGVTIQNQLQYQRYLKTASVDEDGKKSVSYTNAFGQKVATKTYANSTGQEITGFIYDSQGNLKKVINATFQNTIYQYNLSGNMYRKVSVDADTVKYLYDISGNVVLEQDANGKHGRDELNNTSYMRKYTYDIFGRMIEQDRVHYGTNYDPLQYNNNHPKSQDTTKYYNFSNLATLDFYGGWIIESCVTGGGNIYRQGSPSSLTSQVNTIGQPPPSDTTTVPPTNPCHMVYANVYDSLVVSAPEKKWAYHFPVNTSDADLGSTTLANLSTQNHLKGRLNMVKSYTHQGDFSNLSIFSYNNAGLIENEVTQFNLSNTSNSITSIIGYKSYNLRNSLLLQTIDADADGSDDIAYQYVYDGWNRLRIVKEQMGAHSTNKLASYFYDDALGLITKARYFNPNATCNPLIDSVMYTYDVRNRLTSLNSKFYNENLYYDTNLPLTAQTAFGVNATQNFNGNINGLIHTYKLNTSNNYASTAGIMDSSTVYGYKYDGLNRLTKADASVLNVLNYASGSGAYTPRLKYGDETMTYDAIGNMQTLDRGLYYNASISPPANTSQNWTYTYPTTNNHLIDIDSTNSAPLRKYQYNQNGSETTQIIGKSKNSTDYMRSNLPSHTAIIIDTTINNSGAVSNVYYEYNANDDRIYKKIMVDRGAQRYYYLRDASGKEIAEYDITNNQWKYYAYGRERIAEITSSSINFFAQDHLGSVKVVYSTDNNCTPNAIAYTVQSANDYYAFGKTLRSFNSNKYAFTGKEHDAETNQENFGARKYDADIARWTSADPHKEKYPSVTPYNYAANNPVYYIDPDGKDVIVLSYGESKSVNLSDHPWGHQAMLIGNEKDGWDYYSLDGDHYDGIGNQPNNDYTIKHFDDIKSFAESDHNTFKYDYDDGKGKETSEKDSEGNIKQRYKEGYRITTSNEIDGKMKKAAEAVTVKGHNWITNNCTNNVEAALDAGGLKNGENTGVKSVAIPYTNTTITLSKRNYMPQAKQKEIEKRNKGTRVDNELKLQK